MKRSQEPQEPPGAPGATKSCVGWVESNGDDGIDMPRRVNMETPQLRSQLGTAADRDRMAGLISALEASDGMLCALRHVLVGAPGWNTEAEAYVLAQQVANRAAIAKAKGGA